MPLLQFSCNNHMVIGDDSVTLSMMAANSIKTMNERVVDTGSGCILRAAGIFGTNCSGKSSFIDAMKYAVNMILESRKVDSNCYSSNDCIVHRANHDSIIPSEYSFQFVKDGIRYVYGFSIFCNEIMSEYFYYIKKGHQGLIYKRDSDGFEFGQKYRAKSGIQNVAGMISNHELLISYYVMVGDALRVKFHPEYEHIDRAIEFFEHDLVFFDMDNLYSKGTVSWLKEGPDNSEVLLNFMRSLGFSDIKGIDFGIGPSGYSYIMMDYGNFKIHLSKEAEGVRIVFMLCVMFLRTVRNGGVLVYDGFGESLHPLLVDAILIAFYQMYPDKMSQFIFTSHRIDLMRNNLLRADQIWFMGLKEDIGAAELYSLVEFKTASVNKNKVNAPWDRHYMVGRYGALPEIQDIDLIKFMSDSD